MKTKLLLSSLFTFVFYLLSSQVPQGINYQAIARDGAGAILDNKTFNIELTIQTSTGTEIWKELKLVTSNQFGLVNEVLGTGTNLVVPGLASFSMIDWNAQPLFLKTRVQYPGTTWNLLGTSQLWSVPYSLVAKDLEGPVSKLGIEGTTTNAEESLFEVKNKNGEIVFAVYNEGVRVYVPDGAKGAKGGFAVSGWSYNKTVPENYLFVGPDSIRAYIWDDPLEKGAKGGFTVSGFNTSKSITNEFLNISPDSVRIYIDKAPSTKGAKGGFTVSGFGAAKGEEEEYLRVTRDSTRIYINDETTPKGAKGGFAVSGFANAKGGAANFLNVATDATAIINPSQNRILWYPIKNAFLTGKVLIQKPDSVGENSFSSGYESRAKGQYSQALGYKAIARGDYSTAIGKNAIAQKNSSFAFGIGSKASEQYSYAIGAGAEAKGYGAFALGSATVSTNGTFYNPVVASGRQSFAIGFNSQATNNTAFAIGNSAVASGLSSISIGTNSIASAYLSLSLGTFTTSSGSGATAIGFTTEATGKSSVAIGHMCVASGDYSTAMGFGGRAIGDYSFAINLNDGSGAAPDVAAGTFRISNAVEIGGNHAWSNFSDRRLKEDIELLETENNLDKILKLNGIRFRWIGDNRIFYLGLIAQDVLDVLPEVVHYDSLNDIYLMEYTAIIPVLIEGIKEQQLQIESYKSQLQSLQEKVEKIEAMMTKTLVE